MVGISGHGGGGGRWELQNASGAGALDKWADNTFLGGPKQRENKGGEKRRAICRRCIQVVFEEQSANARCAASLSHGCLVANWTMGS